MRSPSALRLCAVALSFFGFSMLRAEQATPQPEKYSTRGATSIVAGTTSMEVLDSTRKLGAGDRLSYRIVEERREPTGLMISDSGELEVPLIGRVQATGRTCKELAQTIKPMLEREYFYHATVIVALEMASTRPRGHVYLSGQVRQQGAMEIPPDEHFTLSKAILKAGGFADFANKRKVKLIRKDAAGASKTTIVDLAPVIDKGQLDKDPELLPDDTVIVPEKFINF